MKNIYLLLLAISLTTSHGEGAPSSAVDASSLPQDTVKIAQVKAKELKMAKASWWGFDKNNATTCLQNAIDSGVPHLVIDNMGSDWMMDKTIKLISNQHILLEDGVVIQAMKEKFKGSHAFLIQGENVHEVTLEGRGKAILRMEKADYGNPDLYPKSEWRHGIAFFDSRNVSLKNLTVTKTGGDGLYLGATRAGYNEKILVEDMIFDDNYRLGMGVISAQDLTIRGCQFINTSGADPQFGIDFEPNSPEQRLVRCVLEDSVLTNNAEGGINVFTVNMTAESQPVSITVNRCKIAANHNNGLAATPVKSTTNGVQGLVTFTDCIFDRNQFFLRDLLVNTVQYHFKDCIIHFNARPGSPWFAAAIILWTDERVSDASIGGLSFDNTVVVNDNGEAPIATHFKSKAKLTDQIKGSLFVQSQGKTTLFDLEAFVRQP